MAVAMLSAQGYTVVAMSGKDEAKELLERLGATSIVPRTTNADLSRRPLESSRWAGVVDTVGGTPLAQALKEVHYDGAVTCCGLVASPELPTTVYPFILRDVSLLGVDSVNCTQEERHAVWNKIAGEWRLPADRLEAISRDVPLEEIDPEINAILEGKLLGRTVVVLP
jgi:putative YhdH/YhfP family quinone oxidoreductase